MSEAVKELTTEEMARVEELRAEAAAQGERVRTLKTEGADKVRRTNRRRAAGGPARPQRPRARSRRRV